MAIFLVQIDKVLMGDILRSKEEKDEMCGFGPDLWDLVLTLPLCLVCLCREEITFYQQQSLRGCGLCKGLLSFRRALSPLS